MRNRPGFYCGLVCLSLALVASSAPVHVGSAERLRAGFDLELLHDTNVNRAAAPDPERSDTILAGEVHGTQAFLLSARSGLIARGGLRVAGHTRYSDLSSVALSGRVDYRYQHHPGFAGTVFQVSAAVDGLQHLDSRIRDSLIGDLSIGVGRHLTDRIRLGAGVGHEWRAARGDVYDTSATRVWGTVDYRLPPRTVLYGRVSYIDGDQVFNSAYGGTQANLGTYGRASAPDPALTRAFRGVTPTAYRVDAKTWVYDAGLNHALDGLRSLDFSVGYFDSEARGASVSYDGWQARLMYLHRFR